MSTLHAARYAARRHHGQGQLRRSLAWASAAEPAAELWLRSVSMLGLSALAIGSHGEASPGSGGGARVYLGVRVRLRSILSHMSESQPTDFLST